MILIENKIISDDVITEKFVCNLNACKGACCWEGDFGAPLELEELPILKQIYPAIKPFLTAEGIAVIEEEGTYRYYNEPEEYGTTLIENGACVFMTTDALGVAQCGIEQAYKAGVTDFKKPISCHLYPIRVENLGEMTALNYDEWDICSAACTLGEKLKMPVYVFLKEPLIRKFGADFYKELCVAATHI